MIVGVWRLAETHSSVSSPEQPPERRRGDEALLRESEPGHRGRGLRGGERGVRLPPGDRPVPTVEQIPRVCTSVIIYGDANKGK